MEYKIFGSTAVVRLDKGDEICACVRAIAEKENITLGDVTAIGATDDFTVGVFDVEKKAYEKFSFTGNHEITALAGNINTMNGGTYTHMHITCAGPGGKIVGGHLLEAKISLTCEMFIHITDGKVDRKRNEELGINTFSFTG